MHEAKKICFVLPNHIRKPIGGHKIVFEYANRLVAAGFAVDICYQNRDVLKKYHLPEGLRRIATNILARKGINWFPLSDKVKTYSGYDPTFLKNIKKYDFVFATGVDTVDFVKEKFSCRKLYFIQGYENWAVSEEYLHSTYGMGFTNIAVANWLKLVVEAHSQKPCYVIKNPVDVGFYKIQKPLEQRRPYTVAALYHTTPGKGFSYLMEALLRLKEKYPDFQAEIFGIPPRPEEFPEWICYTQSATAEETVAIYNRVPVFLCASVEEGFGLTGLEAMACGAALVSTAYQGVLEYADKTTAMLCPIKDVEALVANVSDLFENQEKRIALAQRGHDSVQSLSWDVAMNKMLSILTAE